MTRSASGGAPASAGPLDKKKELLLQVLDGSATPETHPHWFDDDIVYLGVQQLEADDPAWLRAQLADERFSSSARAALAIYLGPSAGMP